MDKREREGPDLQLGLNLLQEHNHFRRVVPLQKHNSLASIIPSWEKRRHTRIIVDSNTLFIPLEFKIDIFTEIERLLNRRVELILISPVKRELEILVKQKSSKTRKDASFALTIAKRCTFVKVKETAGETTDEAILRVAQDWRVPVFTNDKLLKQKLKDISIPTIYLREKSRLEIDGLIS